VHLEEGADPEAALRALASMASEPPSIEDHTVRVPVHSRAGAIVNAVRALDQAGVLGVEDIAIRRPTLDDVFIALTGRAAEDAEKEEVA
jgi:ABC-2 type transport system ATP-binding protein